jgi:hypothetical protein
MAEQGWNTLHLQVRLEEIDSDEEPQLIPWVDGSVLALGLPTRAEAPESGLGMDPEDLLGRGSPLLPSPGGLPYTDIGEPIPRAIVWRCSCGEPGCSSIRVRVSRERDAVSGFDAVIWNDWYLQYGFARDLEFPTPSLLNDGESEQPTRSRGPRRRTGWPRRSRRRSPSAVRDTSSPVNHDDRIALGEVIGVPRRTAH